MTANPIQALHDAYCLVTRQQMRLNMAAERYWFEANKAGLTPIDLMTVVKQRMSDIRAQRRNPACILLRNICGSDEAILDVLNEAAAIKALARRPAYSPGKAEVMKASGRPGAPAGPEAKSVQIVADDLIKRLREAVQ